MKEIFLSSSDMSLFQLNFILTRVAIEVCKTSKFNDELEELSRLEILGDYRTPNSNIEETSRRRRKENKIVILIENN